MSQQLEIQEPNSEQQYDGDLSSELVFFDTFSHDNNEEINLDLVQFRNPVIIREIRIIPLGAKVEADFPGGWRLGATNPSSFDVLFYINDLNRSSCNKFTKFGDFGYKESVNIRFLPNDSRPTNSLILRGKYTVLTLAVFAKLINEDSIKTEKDQLKDHQENEQQNYQNSENQHIEQFEHEIDVSQSGNCENYVAIKTENLIDTEQINGQVSLSDVQDVKPIEEDEDIQIRKREIQPISSPTNDNQEEFDYIETNFSSAHHLEPHSTMNCDSISSLDENDKNLESRSKVSVEETCEAVINDDLEPISPDPTTDQATCNEIMEFELQDRNGTRLTPELQQTQDTCVTGSGQEKEQVSTDLMYISNLTEKVSDDEMCDDFNNEFEINDQSIDQRLESRTSTNSEDLEAISSEEEYFEDVAGDSNSAEGEIFVDYSDDEINQIDFKHEFDASDFVCKPSNLNSDFSLKAKNNSNANNQELIREMIYFDQQNKNSKWIEFIENLDVSTLDCDNDERVTSILIEWVKIGIDFQLALDQENTAFKVRHIKAGLKLLCILIQNHQSLITRLLDEQVLETIYKLFFKPYMTFPIKLLLIKTLDIFTNNPLVLEHVLNHKYLLESEFSENLKDCFNSGIKNSQISEDSDLRHRLDKIRTNLDEVFECKEKTIYELLLILLMRTSETRVSIALSILLKKIHFFEFLSDFKREVCLQLNHNQIHTSSVINTIVENLNEITDSFRTSNQLFGQRSRYLPAKSQFDLKPPVSGVTQAIYNWFDHLDFFNVLIDLLDTTSTNIDNSLSNAIVNFFNQILKNELGTAYFSKVYQTTNRLLEITSKSQLQQFNLTLKHNLYILELIDQIRTLQSSCELKELTDEAQLCLLYNKLYSMIFSELGSKCLIKQLCDNQNLEVLIKFLVINKERSSDKLKLISFHYAINLLIYTIQFSKDRLCELLLKFYDDFLSLSSYSSSTLSKWLSPLKRGIKFNYSESTFELLVSNLKQHSERLKDLKENCTYRVPPDLVCYVQILHHLCIDSNQSLSTNDRLLVAHNQLKYKYGLIQLFTHKGIPYILTIIERLADIFLKPSHLNSSLIGNQGYLLVTLFAPCIDLLKQTLYDLTHCRTSDFKDTSPIVPLLKVYSLMLVFPLESAYHQNSIEICEGVIMILRSYTQLNVNINEVEDEVFNKSIWTKMVKEVINFTTSKPFNFSHGLYLLSQLLPLPLSVKQDDDTNETARLLSFRKLWSAHIHVLFSDIENMLQKLVLCLSPLVKYLLRRVCYQLIDLSSHAGVIVSKCLLSVLDQHLATEPNDNLSSVLDLISFLLQYNLFRNAFICTVSTLNSSIKKDERLDKTIRRVVEIFKSNDQLAKSYASILAVLDAKEKLASATTTPSAIAENGESLAVDLTQMEKLNLHYNNREESIQLDDDFDLSSLSHLDKKLKLQDLIALSKKYFDPSFDVRNQLAVIYKNEEPNFEENFKLVNSKHKHEPLIAKDYMSGVKRPYVAPLRGRGFQRSSNQLGRMHDPFRSRPPNTSRPPSMHVDDFVAMEQNSHQQHQQQNNLNKRQKPDFNKYNKINQLSQRTNLRPAYYNNYRQSNVRMNNNRNSFNRYGNIQTNYNMGINNMNNNNNNNNNNSNVIGNKMRIVKQNNIS